MEFPDFSSLLEAFEDLDFLHDEELSGYEGWLEPPDWK